MKKILLLMLAAMPVLTASAQSSRSSVVFDQSDWSKAKTPVGNFSVSQMPASKASMSTARAKNNSGYKTTNGGSRWYSHRHMIDTINSGTMTSRVFYMWFDSTVKQVFTTGPGTVNWSSEAEFVDPIDFTLFNDPNYNDPTTIQIRPSDAYIVDSVNIQGAYVKDTLRPTSVVDTLLFSIFIDSSVYGHSKNESAWSFFGNYLSSPASTNKDTLYYPRIWTDSVGRMGYSTNTSVPRITWAVPLTDADRTAPTATGFTVANYSFAVPNGGLHVPANAHYAVTCTFKSGDTWNANVDSIENFHVFMPVSGEALGVGTQMPYYYYDYNDLNMSLLLFSFSTGRYQPTLLIEGWNTIAFGQEFHAIETHVTCSTCQPILGVNELQTHISAYAYPNPAHNEIVVPFALNDDAQVSVSLVNFVGQTVQTIDMGTVSSGKASFNVSGLANGIYMYTLTANGAKTSGKVVVMH